MKALVLGGGGAKGSYEVGVWKALNKLNMKFDIVTGVSIGSINGAFYVANEYKKCLKMWRTITTNDLCCYWKQIIQRRFTKSCKANVNWRNQFCQC